MIPERVVAILLSLPLVVVLAVSIRYWIVFGKESRRDAGKQDLPYNKFFLALMAIGFLSIWPFWLGGIVFLFLNSYYNIFRAVLFSFPAGAVLQVVGFVLFYVGSLFMTWALDFAGKYLRPSTAGVYEEHRLIQTGPLGIVRHPYYVSYVLILLGLSLVLLTWLPLVPALCVMVGMYPTAKTEEEMLRERFGEEYTLYQRQVGMFFPRLF